MLALESTNSSPKVQYHNGLDIKVCYKLKKSKQTKSPSDIPKEGFPKKVDEKHCHQGQNVLSKAWEQTQHSTLQLRRV